MAQQYMMSLADIIRRRYISWGGKMSERRSTWPAEMFGGEAGKQIPLVTGEAYGIYINDLDDNDMYIVLPSAGTDAASTMFAFEDDDKVKVTHVQFTPLMAGGRSEWVPIEEKDTYYSSRRGGVTYGYQYEFCGKSSWVRVSTLLKPVIEHALRKPPPGAPTEAQKAAAERRSTYRSTQTGGKLRKRKHKNTRRR